MIFTNRLPLVHILLSFVFFISITSCSNHNMDLYKNNVPLFSPKEFFSGNLTAHGILKNRSGEVTRSFNATIKAYWEKDTGTLEERFLFNDGEIQYRTWKLVLNEDGSYSATAGDVVGTGTAWSVGNAMNLNYVLQIPYGGYKINLSVDDWMYRVDENTVINESILSKWGFRVASIQLAIIRH